jgi:hypothetical protein
LGVGAPRPKSKTTIVDPRWQFAIAKFGWLRFHFMVSRGVKGASRGLTGHSATASPYDLPRQKRNHENAASLRYALPLVLIPSWPPSP